MCMLGYLLEYPLTDNASYDNEVGPNQTIQDMSEHIWDTGHI
jgi:hypothetical protein